jgi:murein DD-endopeptidase MepM/ murein hydrolase activator NlpD
MTHQHPRMRPGLTARPFALRVTLGCAALLFVTACDEPLDFDLRGSSGTASAAQNATLTRPVPDDRGIISYPTYQVAVAKRGDTLTTLATRIGADVTQLSKYNGIAPDVPLRSGEIIALPTRVAEPSAATGAVDITAIAGNAIDASGSNTIQTQTLTPAQSPSLITPVTQGAEPTRHKVQRGETAYTIARLYEVPVQSLAEWNGLDSDFSVREGQFLLIPVARQAPPQPTITPPPGQGSPTPTPPSATKPLPAEKTVPVAAAAAATPAPKVDVGKTTTATATAAMAYPVQGSIIREYSKGKNDGIDISGTAGGAVKSAEAGTVAAITSDANQVPIIVIRHADNLLTVYANITGITVKKGDSVKRGQQIAKLRSGNDAYVHFEVRKGFDSVDPLPYLQ